jgi:glycosyltransferase involved in cell wall biosynthesis
MFPAGNRLASKFWRWEETLKTTSLRNISFVMPVLNEERYLKRAVESVFEQSVPGELELVLSLGPSSDQTDEVAKGLKKKYGTRLQITHTPRANTSASLNNAIAKARFEVVLRVDAHSELSENYASIALEVLNQTGAANVGGIMHAVGESDFQKAVAYGYNNRIGLGGGAFHVGSEAGPKETVYLGVFQKQALEAVGGFDEKWVRGQDWELNQRLRQSGRVVWFDPRLSVSYYPRSSYQDLAQQFFKTGRWRGALTRNNPGAASLRYFLPPLLVLSIPFGLPFFLYLALITVVSASAKNLSQNSKLWLLAVLPTMHLSWGLGFWLGLARGAK